MKPTEAIKKALTIRPEYVAMDQDGSWWAYFDKPRPNEFLNYWSTKNNLTLPYQLSEPNGKKNNKWKLSLRKVL